MRDKILSYLLENHVVFKHLKHEAALTAEMGEKITHVPKEKSIKSLIIKGKKTSQDYLVAILGHQKLDRKALSSLIGEDWTFEDLKVIKDRYHIEPGGAHPFGNLLNLPTFFDESILLVEECIIGSSLPTESFIIKVKDLVRLIQPKMGKIAKL